MHAVRNAPSVACLTLGVLAAVSLSIGAALALLRDWRSASISGVMCRAGKSRRNVPGLCGVVAGVFALAILGEFALAQSVGGQGKGRYRRFRR
jgi:hypothetical protein